jgi:hypothetical protein
MNDIVQRTFDALPPPLPRPDDATTARRIWVRARTAGLIEGSRTERLRLGSDVLSIAAFDAIASLAAASAGAPLLVLLAVLVGTHLVVSLGVLAGPLGSSSSSAR